MVKRVSSQFVEFMPEKIETGILYISIPYTTAVHLCCCGCKSKVVTPITPSDWKFIFDGETVSLYPSIGNWGLKCRSHYWIRENKICWAEAWTDEEVRANRRKYQNQKRNEPKYEKKSFWRKFFGD